MTGEMNSEAVGVAEDGSDGRKQADDALKNLAKQKALTDPRRRRLVAATIAVPTALITTATTLLGLAIEPGNAAMPLWILIPDSTSIIIWIFIFGFLFLISLAAFAVSDRETVEDLRLLQANGASPDQLRRFMRFYSMIPGARGVAIGAVTGLALGASIYVAISDGLIEPLQLLTVPFGAIVTAMVAGSGVGLAARWPRHAIEHRSGGTDVGALLDINQSPSSTGQPTKRSLRNGLVIAGCGLVMTALGSATFNNWPGLQYSMFEQAGMYLLVFGPLALLIGMVTVLPTAFAAIGERMGSGPGWMHYALTDVARNSDR